jgi:hypothetical protein
MGITLPNGARRPPVEAHSTGYGGILSGNVP